MAVATTDHQHAAFASPSFDANDYANAILAGEPYPPASDGKQTQNQNQKTALLLDQGREDVSVAISKLTLNVDDVAKQLKNVVTTNHEALLIQAAGVGALEEKVHRVRAGLDEIAASQDKLRTKVRIPCTTLNSNATRLVKLQCAADALRRIARFVVVARRLESQMAELAQIAAAESSASLSSVLSPSNSSANANAKGAENRRRDSVAAGGRGLEEDPLSLGNESEKERAIAKAALSVAELVALLDAPDQTSSNGLQGNLEQAPTVEGDSEVLEVPLRSVRPVTEHIPAIEEAREKITSEMESMVLSGLASLNRSLLASSLQTAHNLRVLPELVQSLLTDLTDAVEQRIKLAFDIARISKELAAKEPAPAATGLLYRSRVRTEPTNITAPQFGAALWSRIERLMEELADCCIKVYTLEKVLLLKKDTMTQTNFMDEAMKVLENKPSSTYWNVLARTLEKQSKEAAKSSAFMQQTLSTGYPRLLRLFHEFFAKIAVHTDTAYTPDRQSPETIIIIRALATFEQTYLQRSANRLNEVVAQAVAGGARAPPAMGEGLSIARTAANELDAARFDPLLVKAVARNVQSALDMLLGRLDLLIVRDRWATSLLGPVSTPQQTQNAQVATCLFHCGSKLAALEGDYPEAVLSVIRPSVQNIRRAFDKIVEPLLGAVRRDLGAIILKVHKLDLGAPPDPNAGMGGPSTYMKDLAEKLSFVKSEVLAKFNVGDVGREWIKMIAKFVVRTFVTSTSIARPLGEGGKLQLTSDMTELEFALSAFLAEGGSSNKRGSGIKLDILGDEYRALRAMRPLLFLETRSLSDPTSTRGLPPLIVLHHILVRAPTSLLLPHALHGWSEAEYVLWVDEHSEVEALTLVEGVLAHWEKTHDGSGEVEKVEEEREYVELCKAVLVRCLQR